MSLGSHCSDIYLGIFNLITRLAVSRSHHSKEYETNKEAGLKTACGKHRNRSVYSKEPNHKIARYLPVVVGGVASGKLAPAACYTRDHPAFCGPVFSSIGFISGFGSGERRKVTTQRLSPGPPCSAGTYALILLFKAQGYDWVES